MDMSIFDCHYNNDETGWKAYDPKILLKGVLVAYSRGRVGSRRIEWLCRKHVTCMAFACMQHPDHSTRAACVSSMHQELLSWFRDILLACEEQQLLGGTVFALDGLKLASNASKPWSGTIDELQHTHEKLEAKIEQVLSEHQQLDIEENRRAGQPVKTARPPEPPEDARVADEPSEEASVSADEEAQSAEPEAKQVQSEVSFAAAGCVQSESLAQSCTQGTEQDARRHRWAERLTRLGRQAERIKNWRANNDKKIGRQGTEMKSHVTDNESAKMSPSHGVIQGDNAQAVVESKHQVIVAAEAFGAGQDGRHLSVVMPQFKETMEVLGHDEAYLADKQFLADSNYFSDTTLKTCEDEKLDASIPDGNFRKRDPRFAHQKRYKPKKKTRKKRRFSLDDFTYDEATQCYRGPNGKLLRLHAREHRLKHRIYRRYSADEQDCQDCPFRRKCLSQTKPKRKPLGIPVDEPQTTPKSRGQKMIEKIDTTEGKKRYSQRLPIVEPVFANIRPQKGLDHFTLRGKQKGDIQWTLYAMVHNIEKLANYGK